MRSMMQLAAVAALTLSALARDASAGHEYVPVEDGGGFVLRMLKNEYFLDPPSKRDACVETVAAIKASGAKVIHSEWRDSPFLKFGGVQAGDGVDITFENAGKLCAEYERYWLLTTTGRDLLGIAAFLGTLDDTPSVDAAKAIVKEGDRCATLVDELFAAKFPGSRMFVLSGGGTARTKTLDEVKPKVCDVYRAAGEAVLKKLEETEGPLRKVLKADKLDLALSRKDILFFGVGMKTLTTPAQMAASKLWFIHSWSEERSCRSNDKPVHTVRRYQFDAKHMLVTDTSKEFCGAPPRSAYR